MKSLPVLLSLILAVFASCSTSGTRFQPRDGEGGYSETLTEDGIRVTRFDGDAFTRPEDALVFSQFRALEYCKERGAQITRILGTDDKSTHQKIQHRISSTAAPVYLSGNPSSSMVGNYPGNGWDQVNSSRNFSGTGNGGNQRDGSPTWDETLVYPTFDTYFSCNQEVYTARIRTKAVSPKEAKAFLQDGKGAIQIEDVMDDSPNRNILRVGDLIVKVGETRVESIPQFLSAIDKAKDKGRILMRIFRKGKWTTVSAKAKNASRWVMEENNKLISAACAVPELKGRPLCSSTPLTQGKGYP